MKMYIWEVGLELQWKSTWTENKKSKSYLWEEEDLVFKVAAESGRRAIQKAEKIAMAKHPWDGIHYCEDNTELVSRETPYKVLDVVSLKLLQPLDG